MKQTVEWLKSHKIPVKPLILPAVIFVVAVLGVNAIVFSHAATPPLLYLDPANGEVVPDSEISLTIHENSSSNVNMVQTNLGYDKTQLQFVSFAETGPFTQVLSSDSSTPGLVRIARGIPVGAEAVTGDNAVVTVKFKVLATSGSPAVSFDEANSFVTTVPGSQNIFEPGMSQGATLTVKSADTGGTTTDGRLSLDPATVSAKKGDTFTVTLNENSGSESVSNVTASLSYDAAKLQFVGLAEGNVFSNKLASDTATAGSLRFAYGIPVGGGGVSGTNKVFDLSFKLLADAGSTDITLNKDSSMIVTSTNAHNILGFVGGTTVTATSTPPPSNQSGTLSMQPATGTYTTGATFSTTIKATGGSAPLTVAEAVVTYPTDKLQLVSVTEPENGVFPSAQRTDTKTAGKVDVIRGIPGGSAAVTGTNAVVVLNFKVTGTSGSAAVKFATGSGLYDDSGTGTNILDLASSQGAAYTISSNTDNTCTAKPSTPGAPTVKSSTTTSVTLSWQASTAGSNCTLAGYHVLRNGTAIGDVTSGTTFQDTGLVSGTTYTYAVQAFDTAGHTSASSPTVSVTAKADDQAPTAPTGVTAIANASASVALNWNPSTDLPNPGGSGVKEYHIWRNNATTPTYTVTSGTSFTDSDVTADTSYTYTVTAVDNAGNESAPSNVVTVKTAAPACSGNPSAPTGLTATGSTISSVSFSWTASTAPEGCTLTGYKVYRNGTLVGTVTDTKFTDNDVAPNTIYAYTVRAYDSSAHTSDPSAALTISTKADTQAPAKPTDVAASAVSSGRVTLSWKASTDNVAVTGYKVYRNGTLLKTVSATTLSYSDTDITSNTDYTYEVSAIDAAGNESAKAAASKVHTPASTDGEAPTKPAGLKTTVISTDSIALSWTASSDNVGVTGYKVYRNGVFVADSTTTSFTDSGLAENTAYVYTVKAFDAAGNLSAVSAELSVRTLSSDAGGSLVGDLNNDGRVGIYDLSILLKNWGERNMPPSKGELNDDNVINFLDLEILLEHYGRTK